MVQIIEEMDGTVIVGGDFVGYQFRMQLITEFLSNNPIASWVVINRRRYRHQMMVRPMFHRDSDSEHLTVSSSWGRHPKAMMRAYRFMALVMKDVPQ